MVPEPWARGRGRTSRPRSARRAGISRVRAATASTGATRTFVTPSRAARATRAATAGSKTSNASTSISGRACAIGTRESPGPQPISTTTGATRPKTSDEVERSGVVGDRGLSRPAARRARAGRWPSNARRCESRIRALRRTNDVTSRCRRGRRSVGTVPDLSRRRELRGDVLRPNRAQAAARNTTAYTSAVEQAPADRLGADRVAQQVAERGPPVPSRHGCSQASCGICVEDEHRHVEPWSPRSAAIGCSVSVDTNSPIAPSAARQAPR